MAPVITWLKFIVLFFVTTTVARFGFGGGRRFSFPHFQSHNFPAPSGHSGFGSGGSHSYPASTGMSGNNFRPTYHQKPTEVHYHYNPPQQISYGSTYHPVFQGHPPVYVYQYRNSGSRFDNLLTGLALYNLGRNSRSHRYNPDRTYSSPPGEICKLRISKGPVNVEETRIDCNLMSSFIWDTTPSTTLKEQHTKTTSTVEDALKVKGPSIQVTPGMTCSIIRTFRDSTTMQRSVDCGLLQEYARSSLHRSAAQGLLPLKATILHFFFIFYLLRDIL